MTAPRRRFALSLPRLVALLAVVLFATWAVSVWNEAYQRAHRNDGRQPLVVEPQEAADFMRDYDLNLTAWLSEIRADFPFRAGMTVDEVRQLYADNNRRAEALMDEDFKKHRDAGVFVPPICADKDLHLYIYVDAFKSMANMDRSARRFWVNGRTQFWVAMAIDDGKVKNIYLSPGNFSQVLPSMLFDGEGDDVGLQPNAGDSEK